MEKVLAVKWACLKEFLGEKQGVIPDTSEIIEVISRNYCFPDREKAETDFDYAQIIPYVVMLSEEHIFVLRRLKKQTEKRLHGLLSVGIGGHINPGVEAADVITEGLSKELHEEINIGRYGSPEFIGVIRDDSTEVSRVHLGLLYVIRTTREEVSVRETEKMEGGWVSLEDAVLLKPEMESWSKLVMDYMVNR